MGRHKIAIHQPPSNTDLNQLVRRDEWMWVEGREFIPAYDEEKHLAADKARPELAKLGLVLHTQKGETAVDAPLRRKWTTQRMDTQLAAEILEEHQSGISLDDYTEALFDKTADWTPAHQKAAKAKTYVIAHKLKGLGLATRSKNGLLFPTRKQSAKAIPPILLAVVKAHIAELGEEWPDRSVQKLIKLVIEAQAAVEMGKTAEVAYE